jgi:hypothetical protein
VRVGSKATRKKRMQRKKKVNSSLRTRLSRRKRLSRRPQQPQEGGAQLRQQLLPKLAVRRHFDVFVIYAKCKEFDSFAAAHGVRAATPVRVRGGLPFARTVMKPSIVATYATSSLTDMQLTG